MIVRFSAVLACVALAMAGCGGDDDNQAATATTETTTQTETAPTATTKAPAPKRKPKRPGVNQREAAVQAAFYELVEAYELSEQARMCSLLGQPGSNAETCARRADIDLMRLPSSEELSIEETVLNGRLARLTLASGTMVTLRRSGGRWLVFGLR